MRPSLEVRFTHIARTMLILEKIQVGAAYVFYYLIDHVIGDVTSRVALEQAFTTCL